MKKKLFSIIISGLLIIGCNSTKQKSNPKSNTTTISASKKIQANYKKAKMFSLPYARNMNKIFDLSKEYKNKNHVFIFFATWCPACRHELPQINKIRNKYPNTRFIAIDAREPAEKVVGFFNSENLDLPVLIDKNGKTFGLYGIKYIPAVLIVDKNGNIQLEGNHPVEKIEEIVKTLK